MIQGKKFLCDYGVQMKIAIGMICRIHLANRNKTLEIQTLKLVTWEPYP